MRLASYIITLPLVLSPHRLQYPPLHSRSRDMSLDTVRAGGQPGKRHLQYTIPLLTDVLKERPSRRRASFRSY